MGAFGSQRVLQRFMAVESEAKINESRNISLAWIVVIYALSFLLGLLAHPTLEGGPQGVFDIMPGTPGCVAGTIAAVAVAVTLRTAPPSADVVATFDAVVGRATARP